MILLDTNVVSALMERPPCRGVVDWLDERESSSLFMASISIAEIEFGLAILPRGRRRYRLESQFALFLSGGFQHRVLNFDALAARAYAKIMSQRRRIGRPMSVLDGQIAAIALANRSSLATRNVRDFEGTGLDVLNPFD